MEIAKALIVAGPSGDDQQWAGTPYDRVHLFPIANRPLLVHSFEALRTAGVLEAAILTDGGDEAPIREAAAGAGALTPRFIEWEPSSGLAGALAAAEDYLDGEPVFVQHASALLHESVHSHISRFARDRLDALALQLAQEPDSDAGPRTLACLLSPRAIGVMLVAGDRGWNPVAQVDAHGGRARERPVDGSLVSARHVDTLLEANRRALESLDLSGEPATFEDCTVQGPISVHPSARIERTLLRGPIAIGPGAQLKDAYVGPYTSIGAGARIEGAQIEHSIVLADAELRFVGTRLESSLIGRGAQVARGFQLPGAIRVSIGDGAKVMLP